MDGGGEWASGVATAARRSEENAFWKQEKKMPVAEGWVCNNSVVERAEGEGAGVSTSPWNVVESRNTDLKNVGDGRELRLSR